jgi:hypothetical protein
MFHFELTFMQSGSYVLRFISLSTCIKFYIVRDFMTFPYVHIRDFDRTLPSVSLIPLFSLPLPSPFPFYLSFSPLFIFTTLALFLLCWDSLFTCGYPAVPALLAELAIFPLFYCLFLLLISHGIYYYPNMHLIENVHLHNT